MAGSVEAPDQFYSDLLLEFDPSTLRTPVAAPLVFAPPILVVVGPLPIVAINVDAEFRLVFVFLLSVPAVAVLIATIAADALVAVKARASTIPKTAIPKCFMEFSSIFLLRLSQEEKPGPTLWGRAFLLAQTEQKD